MSNPTSLHKPYLVGTAFTGYELTITSDNGVPTAATLSDYNVRMNPVSGTRANVNRFGAQEVMVEVVFTGTNKAAADCQIQLWTWNATTEQWVVANAATGAAPAVVSGSLTKGSMFKVETNPNHRQGYIQVTGLVGGAAAQTAVVTVTKVK